MDKNNVKDSIRNFLLTNPYRMIFSRPVRDTEYEKKVFTEKKDAMQEASYTKTQVFHKNFPKEELLSRIEECMEVYSRWNAWSDTEELTALCSRKGKWTIKVKKSTKSSPKKEEEHNRKKKYLIPEGVPFEALREMGVFTEEGKVVKAQYDKFRQINRFLELLQDVIKEEKRPLHFVDFGCGKSYLTFVVYHYFHNICGYDLSMTGIDLKEDVIRHCSETAERYGYDTLKFCMGSIDSFETDRPVDLVLSLHACDTATDDAIFRAVSWGSSRIFSVPCCQHELNGQMKQGMHNILSRYGIVQERFAALLTDTIRANLLTALGYQTQILEFVDLQHTPKNLLIRAKKQERMSMDSRRKAYEEVKAAMREYKVVPKLYKLLREAGYLRALEDEQK